MMFRSEMNELYALSKPGNINQVIREFSLSCYRNTQSSLNYLLNGFESQ